MSEWNFVIAAYGVTWAVLASYAAYLRRRAARLREAWERATEEGGR